MHRFYVEQPDARGRYPLTAEDAHHARKVLRLQPGSEVELITGGKRYRAKLTEDDLVPVMRGDKKKAADGVVTFALPCGWGDVRAVRVDLTEGIRPC